MAVRSKTTWLIASALIAWTSPALAQAQDVEAASTAPDDAEPDAATSQDIIVTAQKRDQTLIQVPPAMSVVPETTAPKIHPCVKFQPACIPMEAQMRSVRR